MNKIKILFVIAGKSAALLGERMVAAYLVVLTLLREQYQQGQPRPLRLDFETFQAFSVTNWQVSEDDTVVTTTSPPGRLWTMLPDGCMEVYVWLSRHETEHERLGKQLELGHSLQEMMWNIFCAIQKVHLL